MGKNISNVPRVMDGEVKLIAIESLIPFAHHRFALYEGERLDDMVESIKKNGVIVPIIVRTMPDSDKYEIICGHNRVYASGLAGVMKVPAVIKTDMSDEIATIYATDSNLIQRSFSELRISEQAYAVALRYRKLFDEKKIAEIDEELLQLERGKSPVGTGENSNNAQSPLGTEKKIDKFSLTGKDYGLHRTTVTRLIRINELTDDLKKLVDTGNIKIRPAVELSYLSTDVQKMLYECMSRTGINTISQNTAWELKELCQKQNDVTPGMIEQILNGNNALSVRMDRSNRIALDREVFERYFKGVPKKEVVSIVEKALEMYFKGERA